MKVLKSVSLELGREYLIEFYSIDGGCIYRVGGPYSKFALSAVLDFIDAEVRAKPKYHSWAVFLYPLEFSAPRTSIKDLVCCSDNCPIISKFLRDNFNSTNV